MTPREIEERFLTKLSVCDSLDPILRAKVTPDWFTDPACRRAFDLQVEHHTLHGKPGTFALYTAHALGIQQSFAPTESLETLVEELRVSTIGHLTRKAAARYLDEVDSAETPIQEAHNRLVQGVTDPTVLDLLGQTSQGGSLAEGWGGFLSAERRFRENAGVTGIPYPWPSMSLMTAGLNPGDYVPILGFKKAGKTDVGIEILMVAALDYGEPVLMISNEIAYPDARNRCACRAARVPYRAFRHGVLTLEQRARLDHIGTVLKHNAEIVIEHVSTVGLAAVARVRSLIQQLKPSVLLWDGHHLSAASDEWKDVYQLSRRTRSLMLDVNIAGIVTTQLNPQKVAASYKAYHQDATASIRIDREGPWIHVTTPDVREDTETRWSMKCERGLPLLELPYAGTNDPAHPGKTGKAGKGSQEGTVFGGKP